MRGRTRSFRTQFGMRKPLEHGIRAGHLLIAAREKLARLGGGSSHRLWLPWLKTYCGFSARTAQRYMECARDEDQIRHCVGFAEAAALLHKQDRAAKVAEKRQRRAQNEIEFARAVEDRRCCAWLTESGSTAKE